MEALDKMDKMLDELEIIVERMQEKSEEEKKIESRLELVSEKLKSISTALFSSDKEESKDKEGDDGSVVEGRIVRENVV